MSSLIPRAIKYARRFRGVEKEIRARRDFEALPREAIRAFQLARFNELWPFAVRIKVVPRIDVTAVGKHRLIINRMPPEGGSVD